jgi:hypothetical protein
MSPAYSRLAAPARVTTIFSPIDRLANRLLADASLTRLCAFQHREPEPEPVKGIDLDRDREARRQFVEGGAP